MFDINALVDVTITGFDNNMGDATPYNMEIYYKTGTHVGFEGNAAAWTLAGTANGVNGAGVDLPTAIPIVLAVTIAQGQTTAFYITDTGGAANIDYTDGTGVGAVYSDDGNIQILEGTGKDYAFGTDYTPRIPNITVYYECCPAPDIVEVGNSCSGMADGSIEATGQGVGPWVYEITDVNGVIETSVPTNGPYTFTGLNEGLYSVYATDGAGCTAVAPAELIPTLPMTISSVVVDNQCFGGLLGEATITVAGGTAPFDIAWTDAFGNVLLLDPQINGTSALDGLSAGGYLVGAIDAAGCSVTVPVSITEPVTPLELYLSPQNLTCFESADGEVGASQSGLPPYFFEIADVFGNPVQSSSNPADYTFTGLDAGIYFVTATDANGCLVTDDIELFEPDDIDVEISSTPVLCFNGTEGTASITSVSGGTTPYGQTTWNDPTSQTGNAAIGLAPGIVLATVIDANGCDMEVEFDFDNPPPLTLTGRYLTDTCGQGKGAAIVDVELGTPPYEFMWKPDSVDTGIHYGLSEGSYEVVVTDDNGCKDSTFVSVADDIPYPIAAFDYRIEGETLLDQQVQFLNNSNGTSQWTWFFGNGESSNERDPKFHYDRAGDYLVQLLASNGFCVDTVYDYVNIDPLMLVYVPNAFTPGINGKNDTFYPQGEGIEKESYDMFIFDRWGKLVWQTGNFSKEWDGTHMDSGDEVPVGTYVYKITFREYANLDRRVYTGIVNVIRD
jgi:gliding motility-associated-like protein